PGKKPRPQNGENKHKAAAPRAGSAGQGKRSSSGSPFSAQKPRGKPAGQPAAGARKPAGKPAGGRGKRPS
ncbi:ATP-dependent helicase, partial [Pseudomonas sp. MWU13-2625]